MTEKSETIREEVISIEKIFCIECKNETEGPPYGMVKPEIIAINRIGGYAIYCKFPNGHYITEFTGERRNRID